MAMEQTAAGFFVDFLSGNLRVSCFITSFSTFGHQVGRRRSEPREERVSLPLAHCPTGRGFTTVAGGTEKSHSVHLLHAPPLPPLFARSSLSLMFIFKLPDWQHVGSAMYEARCRHWPRNTISDCCQDRRHGINSNPKISATCIRSIQSTNEKRGTDQPTKSNPHRAVCKGIQLRPQEWKINEIHKGDYCSWRSLAPQHSIASTTVVCRPSRDHERLEGNAELFHHINSGNNQKPRVHLVSHHPLGRRCPETKHGALAQPLPLSSTL